jgi:hypothetical protein
MKLTHFLSRNLPRLTLTAAFFAFSLFAQAQNYLALYDDNTYNIIDQTTVNDMLVAQKRTNTFPLLVFKINNAGVAVSSQMKANGAGTRRASSQASAKPGLKSTTADNKSFDILCNCNDDFYVRGSANAKENDCETTCSNMSKAVARDMPSLVRFFHNEGIEIGDEKGDEKDKEKAKSKAEKGSK